MSTISQKLSMAWNNFKFMFLLKSFWRNRFIASTLIISIVINSIIWYLWYFEIRVSGYPVYSPISLLQFSEKLHFYFLPILGIGAIILNLLLGIYAFKKERLASYFLLGSALFIQIIIFIFLIFFLRYSLL